jgi:hypothetical protein
MHTKLHNCKETTLRERKTLVFVRWDKVAAGTLDTKSSGSLSYFLQEITHFFQQYKSTVTGTNDIFEVLNYYYYYYYYYYCVFCQRLFLLGISLEPTVIPTARA